MDPATIITILEVLGGVLQAVNGTINAIEKIKEGKQITNDELVEIRKSLIALPDLQDILEAVKRGESVENLMNKNVNTRQI